MGLFLGVDYGTKRIGLAIGDSTTRLATPLPVLPATGSPAGDAEVIVKSLAEYDVSAIVVGLPLNMDDTEGPQARITRTVGQHIERLCSLPLTFFDERLSSKAADETLVTTGLSARKRKRRRDSVAAQIMLQSFLDSLAG